MSELDSIFAGSVPRLYDTLLVPLIFAPYARDAAHRIGQRDPQSVLEVASGTGVAAHAIADALPSASIVATDLNQGMIDWAKSRTARGNIDWRIADAQELPFDDASFDVVLCQFGAMFFPDRPRAFSEARRVLKEGGLFVLSAWDRIEENEFADIVTRSLEAVFPDDPPRFLARTPHGYSNRDQISDDLRAGGFTSFDIETIPERSRAESPSIPAIGYCQGTPLRNEITARDSTRLEEATNVAADAIRREFGAGMVDGKIQAHVITAVA